MPIKKIKRGAKAVVGGIKDYGKQKQASHREAEKTVKKSGSRVQDVKNVAKKARQIRKAKGQSLTKAIKTRYKHGDIGK